MANTDYEEADSGMDVDTPSEASSKTALLPTEFFSGKDLSPGTECKVRVERVLEGQVEVSYVPHTESPEMQEDQNIDEEMNEFMDY